MGILHTMAAYYSCKCMYICILHLYYICGCISVLQCQVSIALVSGHYTWVAGHVLYACILCTPTHCIICTLQGGLLWGIWALLERPGTCSQSWKKASGIGHPRAIQPYSSIFPFIYSSIQLYSFLQIFFLSFSVAQSTHANAIAQQAVLVVKTCTTARQGDQV